MRSLPVLLALCLALVLSSCSTTPVDHATAQSSGQIVRVQLLNDQMSAAIVASSPTVTLDGRPVAASFPAGPPITVALSDRGWVIGNQLIPAGVLQITPSRLGGVTVNGSAYRGVLRFIAQPGEKFDVINDVGIDDYLRGVIAKEMLPDWADEAYKAQAVVARTYALFEAKSAPAGRSFDLYPDQRSQVYGGINGETDKSRRAVDATLGEVVVYGPPGAEKIFKTYFSSCCGGIGQNPTDALGEPFHPALVEQNVGQLCSASPRFNWGPITISKDELTRRIKLWGKARGRAEADLQHVSLIRIAAINRYGRPVRFMVIDVTGTQYSLTGEELRWAVNTDAPKNSTLFSSYCQPTNAGTSITFTGHGFGHGIGMCQWCAETRALQGMKYLDIVTLAYPGARIVRAY